MVITPVPEIDIKDTLQKISKMGFVPTLRSDDTGIGYTLEILMAIKENNSGEADLKYLGIPVELKAQRKKASSNITLITKSPNWNPLPCKGIIEKYGYKDVKKRQGLKVTLKATEFNSQGLKFEIINGNLNIVHKKDGVICYFVLDELMLKIRDKLFENLLLVFADSKKIKGIENFHYNEAYLLTHLSEEKLTELIKGGFLVFEFRMHIKESGSVRDHGSGFRLNRRHITQLYEKREKIL
ncbi:MAG TPA: MvaI/BcnI family restriction endonuclease [Candidatus Nanoarchaeia archaeon]|nr:MvaI/BcnI family restriction endonuclease [Candidatus Nanoarchaeia archaeon]